MIKRSCKKRLNFISHGVEAFPDEGDEIITFANSSIKKEREREREKKKREDERKEKREKLSGVCRVFWSGS